MELSANVGSYYIKRFIGEGGFGSVHEAQCLQTGHIVAMKKVKTTCLNAEGKRRAAEECKIQSNLNHPAIVKLYTSFEEQGYIYLILELCDKGDLKSHITKYSQFTEKEVADKIYAIVDALVYLKSQSVIHRDVKLKNLMVCHDGSIKLGDFGVAAIVKPGRSNKTVCGTPRNMAPEVWDQKKHDYSVDTWGLGIVLHELLTGEPFQRTDSCYQAPQHLSDCARDLLTGLLRPVPRDRISIENAQHHPFFSEAKRVRRDSGNFTSSYIKHLSYSHSGPVKTDQCLGSRVYGRESGNGGGSSIGNSHSGPVKTDQCLGSRVYGRESGNVGGSSSIGNSHSGPVKTDQCLGSRVYGRESGNSGSRCSIGSYWKAPDLDTSRLLPRNTGQVKILENGCVQCSISSRQYFLISADGKSVSVRHHNSSQEQIYNCDELPVKLRKRYMCAASFVAKLRTKTLKIRYADYTAECSLMEDTRYFSVKFIAGKCVGGVVMKNNEMLTLGLPGKETREMAATRSDLWRDDLKNDELAYYMRDRYEKYLDLCLNYDSVLSNVPVSADMHSTFPARFGILSYAQHNKISSTSEFPAALRTRPRRESPSAVPVHSQHSAYSDRRSLGDAFGGESAFRSRGQISSTSEPASIVRANLRRESASVVPMSCQHSAYSDQRSLRGGESAPLNKVPLRQQNSATSLTSLRAQSTPKLCRSRCESVCSVSATHSYNPDQDTHKRTYIPGIADVKHLRSDRMQVYYNDGSYRHCWIQKDGSLNWEDQEVLSEEQNKMVLQQLTRYLDDVQAEAEQQGRNK